MSLIINDIALWKGESPGGRKGEKGKRGKITSWLFFGGCVFLKYCQLRLTVAWGNITFEYFIHYIFL